MRFTLTSQTENAVTLMRRLGYVFQYQKDGEMSFVRPLAQAGFPRFHCYTKVEAGKNVFNLHLDQRKETYGKETRHHGEYANDGALQEELQRIEESVGALTLLA